MAVNLSPVGGVAAQFFTNSGTPLTGGKIFTYAAGTTTPQATYTSSQGNVPWTNPIVLDAAGRVPSGGEIWLTDGLTYKFLLKDANDVLIATYDNISGINSNFIAFTNQQEIVTATAGQTVFNLGINYQPGTNSLSVFVDGVNQYGPGALYAYVETDSNTVTFTTGLHVGAEVKFTTSQQQGAGAVDAEQVSYTPPFTGSVPTNVEVKLAQTVSVMDFGADPTGVADSTAAIQAAINTGKSIVFPDGVYLANNLTQTVSGQAFVGIGRPTIRKNANGMLLTASGRNWSASNIVFDARSGGYTGGGISGTEDAQVLAFCGVRTSNGYAVELRGSATKIIGSNDIYFTDDASAGPIKIGSNSVANAQYVSIIGVDTSTSAGNFVIENAGNVWVTSCQTKNILATVTGGVQVSSCRVVGHLTFLGSFSSVSNTLIAGNLTIGNGSTAVSGIRIAPDVQAISTGVVTINALVRESVIHVDQMSNNTIVDNLTGTAGDVNNVFFGKPTSYTPIWGGGDGTQSIGNGTLDATYVRKGRTIQVVFNMQMGSTTTYGTGAAAYNFSLPTTTRNIGYPYYGIGELFQTTARLGVLRAQSNSNVFEFINEGYAGPMRYNRPEVWATGQRARGQIEYLAP